MKKFLEELYLDLQYRGASYLYDFGKKNPEAMYILVSDLINYKTPRSRLSFDYQQLYTIKDGLYYWKTITCGRYCFKRVDSEEKSTPGILGYSLINFAPFFNIRASLKFRSE